MEQRWEVRSETIDGGYQPTDPIIKIASYTKIRIVTIDVTISLFHAKNTLKSAFLLSSYTKPQAPTLNITTCLHHGSSVQILARKMNSRM